MSEGMQARLPMVSALMPTTQHRHEYITMAVQCFAAQTYPCRELVILDDDDYLAAAFSGSIPRGMGIRYFSGCKAATLGEKRNALCGLARGRVLIHWDDDDWYAPERIATQVARLLDSGRGVTGYHSFFYWDEVGARAYRYQYTGQGFYASGSTQCYLRSWWKCNQFPPVKSAEDSEFSFRAAKAGQLLSVPAESMMVARGHWHNTFKQPFGSHGFPPVATRELPAGFLAEIGVRA